MGFIKKEDIDLKWIFIIILGGIVIWKTLFTGGSDKIDTKDEELERLTQENIALIAGYDSLGGVVDSLDERYVVLEDKYQVKDDELKAKNNEIDKLKAKRYEVSNYVNSLHSDSIAPTFTNYLQRRGGSNN